MNLKDHYEGLDGTPPISQQQVFRTRVISECAISETTFYRWLRRQEQIPVLAKIKINEIVEKMSHVV